MKMLHCVGKFTLTALVLILPFFVTVSVLYVLHRIAGEDDEWNF